MSNYRIVITKVEPNPEYQKMIEENEKMNRGRYHENYDRQTSPQREITTDVLIAEVTEEQYATIKAEVIKVF